MHYPLLLKTGSLDNANQEFSLVYTSWYMSLILCSTNKCVILGGILIYFSFTLVFFILGVFSIIKIIIPLAFVGNEMTITNLARHASLAIFHLISKYNQICYLLAGRPVQ